MTELPVHPLSAMFPLGSAEELRVLTASIKEAKQLLEPITTYQGQILDGRRRQTAALKAGIKPVYVEWNGECGSPEAFVIAKNIYRRNVNITDRVNLLLKLQKLMNAAAKTEPAPSLPSPPQAPAFAALPVNEQAAAVRQAESQPRRDGVDQSQRDDQIPRSLRKICRQWIDRHGRGATARQALHKAVDEMMDEVLSKKSAPGHA